MDTGNPTHEWSLFSYSAYAEFPKCIVLHVSCDALYIGANISSIRMEEEFIPNTGERQALGIHAGR